MSALIHQSRRFQSQRTYTYPELRAVEAPQRQIRMVAGAKPAVGEPARRSEGVA